MTNKTTAAAAPKTIVSEIMDTGRVIVEALLIAFVVRMFLFQPFNIPSASMYPTLNIGDYLFVSKFSYGYGKYSFNFQLSLPERLGGGTVIKCCSFINFPGRSVFSNSLPQRGDVAVFKYPQDLSVDYIKRVIGLPGDHIQMKDGVLFINGQAVKKERIEDYVDSTTLPEAAREGTHFSGGLIPQYRETLPNGVSYTVLDQGAFEEDNTIEYVVPEGHYFMMGDNRDNSADSRFLNGVGYVPLENFVGKAEIIFFSFKPEASLSKPWEWPALIRYARFFNWVQ